MAKTVYLIMKEAGLSPHIAYSGQISNSLPTQRWARIPARLATVFQVERGQIENMNGFSIHSVPG